MSIWIVYNGYVGEASTGCLVQADTEADAITQASAALKVEAERPNVQGDPSYPDDYWRPEGLTAVRCTLPLVGSFDI